MKYILLMGCCLFSTLVFSQVDVTYTQNETTYGYRDGLALTMTVLTPKKPNGKAIVSLKSGGWVSNLNWNEAFINRAMPFVNEGYTVFLTMHSSGPRYAIPDALEDVQRAVQFVRYNAKAYKIDKEYIGITGTSSGGHLSLLAGTSDDIANPAAKDPVEQVSSKVQAVAVFCPPTDFLHYGFPGFNLSQQTKILPQYNIAGAFQYTKWNNETKTYQIITDPTERLAIDTLISPAEMVTKDDAPAYIIHGDKDDVVPLQQSQLMEQKLKAGGIPVTLILKPGAGHGWESMNDDEKGFIAWFDKYLKVGK